FRASLLLDGSGGFSARGVRALEACWRAGVEVVPYSGRRQSSVFESARMLGSCAYVFELGCGLVIDDELEWLTGGLTPSDADGSIYDQIEASGAPALLLERYAGMLEYHTPWSAGREVSHLLRGSVDIAEAHAALAAAGLDWLRLVDNGVIRADAEQMSGSPIAGAGAGLPIAGAGGELPIVRAYHLIPGVASKARAVARHMQARGYSPEDCIAVGDSREDMGAREAVGTFWLVANALERDPSLARELHGLPRVRVAEEGYGAGVYEAVVTTLAERG
ncbi:MAG: hypothetical protein M3Y17_11575, partial [Actinomycetota bacterium]|nr:hypothetical protein [Actinomycetota bacterium]